MRAFVFANDFSDRPDANTGQRLFAYQFEMVKSFAEAFPKHESDDNAINELLKLN